MPMDRNEALRLLAADRRAVPEGEEYTARCLEPADAPGVARLFYAVYGDGYPIDTFYIPERLVEENRRGNIRSVVARTASGDVVAHVALYRSSPVNPNLYEYGVGLTLPAYRDTMAFFRATRLIMELVGTGGIDGIFGEAVCNHTITQKLVKYAGLQETALEPALMPARTYEAEGSADGRVGCIVSFRVDTDHRRLLHVPPAYREELAFLLHGLNLDRELVHTWLPLAGDGGRIDVKRFDFAGVARCTFAAPGENLGSLLVDLERGVREDGFFMVQVYVDLGKPWSGSAVELLRGHGYSLGGLLPIWFGSDGLLMQKHFCAPGFDGLRILTERGRRVLEMVRHDWERSGK